MDLDTSNVTWKIVIGNHTIRRVGSHGDTKEMIQHLMPFIDVN